MCTVIKEVYMNSEAFKILIPSVTTLLSILITQYIANKINTKANRSNITEQQYKLIFAPIKKVFMFSNDKEAFCTIKNLIEENFELLPNQLTSTFKECLKENKITDEFIQQIDFAYIRMNNLLSYSIDTLENTKIKYNNKIIILSNNVMKSSVKTFIAALIIVTISFLLSIINIFINNATLDCITTLITISAFIVEIFPFIIYIVRIFIEYLKYNIKSIYY